MKERFMSKSGKNISIKEELIKEVGSYTASVKLHRDVYVEIPFEITAE
jgi:large subunit ribosomal protein L9